MENKKYNKDEALAKIKARINHHYENIGREDVVDTDEARRELIEDIEEILNNTNVSIRHLIIEKLQLDDEVKNSLKEKWK